MNVTVAVYGDSISTGTHGGGGWTPALASLGQVTVHNHAISSSPLAATAPGNLVEVLAQPRSLHPDADAVVLWHGSNDWYWASPVGDFASGPASFLGALTHCAARLRADRHDLPIITPTPLWRFERPHGCVDAGDASSTPNAVGQTLRAYRDALIRAAPALGLHLVDMDAAGISAETASALLEDGVHPNRAGYRAISALLIGAVAEAVTHG